ncbi:unnamed protein product [Leptidea sinapis]|uniref:Uncharacterized protein n=1 Tax=Leptidea sinapis TaxID=189913 RepID=A0A5E4QDS1_9NEOP|nr:unnamed protein product [Leptidea sinapis]
MKLFVAFVVLIATAAASPLNRPIDVDTAHIQAIIEAIESPNTDSTTALLLKEQLYEILNTYYMPERPEEISASPAIEEEDILHGIDIGPAFVDHMPAVKPEGSALVQVIVNVKSKAPPKPSPLEPENSVDDISIIPQPSPVAVEAELEVVNVQDPIFVEPAVNLPEILN